MPSAGSRPLRAVGLHAVVAGAPAHATGQCAARHAAGFGFVAPLGEKNLARLQAEATSADDAMLPGEAQQALALPGREVDRIEARLAEINARLMQRHKASPLSRRLAGFHTVRAVAEVRNVPLRPGLPIPDRLRL